MILLSDFSRTYHNFIRSLWLIKYFLVSFTFRTLWCRCQSSKPKKNLAVWFICKIPKFVYTTNKKINIFLYIYMYMFMNVGHILVVDILAVCAGKQKVFAQIYVLKLSRWNKLRRIRYEHFVNSVDFIYFKVWK